MTATAEEWLATLTSAAELRNNAPVEVLVAEWRSTAEIYADPELYERQIRFHPDRLDGLRPVLAIRRRPTSVAGC